MNFVTRWQHAHNLIRSYLTKQNIFSCVLARKFDLKRPILKEIFLHGGRHFGRVTCSGRQEDGYQAKILRTSFFSPRILSQISFYFGRLWNSSCWPVFEREHTRFYELIRKYRDLYRVDWINHRWDMYINLNLNTAKKFIKFWILILDYGSEGKFCLNFVHSNYSLGVRLGLNGEGGDGVNPNCLDLPLIIWIPLSGFRKLLSGFQNCLSGFWNWLSGSRIRPWIGISGILPIEIYKMSGFPGFWDFWDFSPLKSGRNPRISEAGSSPRQMCRTHRNISN